MRQLLRTPAALIITTALALAISACSGQPAESGPATSAAPVAVEKAVAEGRTKYPLTIDNCGIPQTFDKSPSRVAILNGASVNEVESMVLLGLSDRIVVNTQAYGVSDDPLMVDRVNALPNGGVEPFKNKNISAEKLIETKPDLVLSTWSGGFNPAQGEGAASRDDLKAIGAKTLVTPVNCAMGKDHATSVEVEVLKSQGVQSSLDYIKLLGEIFDVQDRADKLVAELDQQIKATSAKVAGKPPVSGLVAYPGMSMMNSNGLPAVMTGGIYDDILAKAGVRSAFAGNDRSLTQTLNEEQLAQANVELLVLGGFQPTEDLDAEATKLFERYPQWPASKNKRYVKVSDGMYLGPLNGLAIEKIARAAHPDAF